MPVKKKARPATVKNVRASIPSTVKHQLWVAAGGRCEFKTCNAKLHKNVLTQQALMLAEHAHIIGDSVHGPRGDAKLSKSLAQDSSNIILVCKRCHTTIDQLEESYPVDLLREMKRHHEKRIGLIFDIDDTKDSIPIILRHPIKKNHVPRFTISDVHSAIMRNSAFSRCPSEELISIDFSLMPIRDDEPASWEEAGKRLREQLQGDLRVIEGRVRIEHLSVFAFAPMPLLMQLGFLLGNKGEVSTFQWDRVTECWDFRIQRQLEQQSFLFDKIPESCGGELAVVISLSSEVMLSAVAKAVPALPMVQFRVTRPTPLLVETADDILRFRTGFTQFMSEVRSKGYQRIHLFPAMPLSLCVELGRQLMPKADPRVVVWDFQDSTRFVKTLQLSLD